MDGWYKILRIEHHFERVPCFGLMEPLCHNGWHLFLCRSFADSYLIEGKSGWLATASSICYYRS